MIHHKTIVPTTYTVTAPAKLNLRLKITGRREDGYHLLSMLNVPLELADALTLHVATDNGLELEVDGDIDALGEENLVVRAARVFFEEFGVLCGLRIQLTKNIPVGAGLGGGSSDAAATLEVLHKVFFGDVRDPKTNADSRLIEVAARIGTDVPFFFSNGLAHVTGVGENVRPLENNPLSGMACVLCVPRCGVSTPEIYQRYRCEIPTRELREDSFSMSYVEQRAQEQEDVEVRRLKERALLVDNLENDLATVVFRSEPRVASAYQMLTAVTGVRVSLCGSGAAVFALPAEGEEFTAGELTAIHAGAAELEARIIETRIR